MRKKSWSETEQMKVVWNVIDSEMLFKTKPRTKERKVITDKIVTKLLADPDFSERLTAQYPKNTIEQHVLAWVGYLEGRRNEKPPLIR